VSRDIFRRDTNNVEKLLEDPENMFKLTTPMMMQLFGKEDSRCSSPRLTVSKSSELVHSPTATKVGLVDVKIGHKVNGIGWQP
jgi:hypothetical protein